MNLFPFLTVFAAIFHSLDQTNAQPTISSKSSKTSKATKVQGGFHHGVASGSPLPTAMILWTRYTPIQLDAAVEIEYRIAKVESGMEHSMDHDDFSKLLSEKLGHNGVRFGKAVASPERDWVIKLDITGLTPGSSYVYGFTDGYVTSPVGKTKTPPEDEAKLDSLTFAFFSCANFTGGYFHAYDVASAIVDLDFWFHAGDYIYEYGNDICENGRCWEPTKDVVSLDEYRKRYASYHLDEGLQNLRRSAALISTWDDHEIANNGAKTGAENHNPDTQGLWADRVKAARQAYLEWMPFRESNDSGLNGLPTQSYEFGDLMTFVTVDSRIRARSLEPAIDDFVTFQAFLPGVYVNNDTSLYGRDPLLSYFQGVADEVKAMQYDPTYEMIGEGQLKFIEETFQKSSDAGKPWQIFGDQTMMAKSFLPCLSDFYTYFPPTAQPIVKAVIDAALSQSPPSSIVALARASCAMSVTETPYQRDSWDGYSNERKKVLEVLSNNSSTPLVLFGDSHDSWAFQIDRDGNSAGTPVTVNIGTPGVTSRGLSSQVEALFLALQVALAQVGIDYSMQTLNDILAVQVESTNKNLIFSNVFNKGFVVVHLSRTQAVMEFFGFEKETIAMDFATARSTNHDGITADFFCMSSIMTKAEGQPSLEKQSGCGNTTFAQKRPGYWNTTFSAKFASRAEE